MLAATEAFRRLDSACRKIELARAALDGAEYPEDEVVDETVAPSRGTEPSTSTKWTACATGKLLELRWKGYSFRRIGLKIGKTADQCSNRMKLLRRKYPDSLTCPLSFA